MTERVWTSPDTARAVGVLNEAGFTPVKIAFVLHMDIGKVRAILCELAADETALVQIQDLAGPKLPLSQSPDQGGATGTGGAL